MIRVLLFGCRGRMGRIAALEIAEAEDLQLVAGVEREGSDYIPEEEETYPVIPDDGNYPEADVWLDFSLAEPAVRHAGLAANKGIPLVIAATGFSIADEEQMEWYSKRCPLLIAPNLSAGVGTLENIAVTATRLLPEGFEAVLTEIHHSAKKDAPSGTAKRLARRMGDFGVEPKIISVRAGGAVGEHRIHFIGANEELILTHRAWSRRAFSSGIPRALTFIVRQQVGLYSVQDIYGLD